MIKNGDFVNVDYTGRVEGKIFDLTSEHIAKEEKVYDEKTKYGSVTVVVGAGHLLKGVEEALVGKKEGDEFETELPPEKGFGKKNAKLLKIVPLKAFTSQKVNPYPGLTVNIDNVLGNVLSVSGGRVIVDFNHPLAGKILNYKVKVNHIITDKKAQAESLVDIYTSLDKKEYEIELKENHVKLKLKKELPENFKKVIEEDIKKYIKMEKVEFEEAVKKPEHSSVESSKHAEHPPEEKSHHDKNIGGKNEVS